MCPLCCPRLLALDVFGIEGLRGEEEGGRAGGGRRREEQLEKRKTENVAMTAVKSIFAGSFAVHSLIYP